MIEAASMAVNLVGIDLGTTFSAIATLDDTGKPTILPNSDNEMLTPSAVLLLDDGVAVVGQAALDVAMEQPDRVATMIKRKIGKASFGTVANREFRPETLSAIILAKLIKDAEVRLGPIKKAVITVPAYFDDTRRKATQDAGRIAGLDVLDILDEPTAAALAYSLQQTRGAAGTPQMMKPQTVLVYDLGGGTFDVTLVRLAKNHFQTLAIEGDAELGGKDWDDCIVHHVAQKFIEAHAQDPRQDEQSLAGLRAAAERAKRTLSKLPRTTVTCSHGGKTLSVPLTRDEFEAMTASLLFRTRYLCGKVLRDAALTWAEVDRVLLVGGSTHMPMTSRMLHDLTGKQPDNSLAVSEVVARGAALHAGILLARQDAESGNRTGDELGEDAREMLEDVVEINVNAHSLGIEARDSENVLINDILIPKNTMLPVAASRVYFTKAENQQRVRVKVLQGEAPQAKDCIPIGECWIDGLPPNLPKSSPIQVRCGVASNGLIDILALDMTSGKIAHTVIHRTSGLTEEEIEREAAFVRTLQIQ
jgi:molecular chaperone DnaK